MNKIDYVCYVRRNEIENEAHFLFSCDLYNNYRSNFETSMGTALNTLDVAEKFDLIFRHPHGLGRFLRKQWMQEGTNCTRNNLTNLCIQFSTTFIFM